MTTGTSQLDRLRNSAHTGENRCVPCTVVNVAIAAVASALLWFVTVELAAVAFVASLATIYLRGYLVPGTPALTKRYLPDRIRAVFDDHHVDDDEPTFETLKQLERARKSAVNPSEFLQNVGALEPTADGTDLQITDEFADAVHRHAESGTDESVRTSALAAIFDVDPAEVTFLDRDYPAIELDIRIRKWPSAAALTADVAAHAALAERTDRWAEVPVLQRREILRSLRGFHDECVDCGGPVRFSEDVVDSCCGQHEVTTVACADCGQRFLEFDQARVGAEEEITGMTP